MILNLAGPAAGQDFQIPVEDLLQPLSPAEKAAMERQITTETLDCSLSSLNEALQQLDVIEELMPQQTGKLHCMAAIPLNDRPLRQEK
jgi:hypothetical protein